MSDLLEFSNQFDDLPEDEGFAPIPAGEYQAMITDTEWKMAASGNEYLNVSCQVVGGNYDGRLFWIMLNLKHSKQNVAQIAMKELRNLIGSIGMESISDTSELEDKIFRCLLKVDDKTPEFVSNRVAKYLPKEATATPQAPAQQQAPSGDTPW